MPRHAIRVAVPDAARPNGGQSDMKRRARPGRWARAALLGLALGGWASAGMATPLPAGQQGAQIEEGFVLSPRRPILAHVRFCLLYEGQCDRRSDRRAPGLSLAAKLDEATRINRAVNRAITPKPDVGFDSWDIDVTAGDCEDYALQKRKELVDLGWPTADLRIAVTRTARGEPHAVLLVRIGRVDYVLDNLHDRVLPWEATGHSFLMVQDRDDPRAWHDLRPRRGTAGTS